MNAAKLILFNFFCLWLCATVFSSVFSGCSAEKKAQRAAEKQEVARQRHIADLKEMRVMFPCDTIFIGVDSSEYTQSLRAYNLLVDSLYMSGLLNNKDVMTTNVAQTSADRVIKIPFPVKVKELKIVRDSGYYQQLLAEIASLKFGGDKLRGEFDETVEKLAASIKREEELRESRNSWRLKALITWGLIGALTGGLILLAYLKK